MSRSSTSTSLAPESVSSDVAMDPSPISALFGPPVKTIGSDAVPDLVMTAPDA
jgi:hypothetical protein